MRSEYKFLRSRERFNALKNALEESVKLQSHYAGMLNTYDGGKRLRFADAKAWMDRLEECKKP